MDQLFNQIFGVQSGFNSNFQPFSTQMFSVSMPSSLTTPSTATGAPLPDPSLPLSEMKITCSQTVIQSIIIDYLKDLEKSIENPESEQHFIDSSIKYYIVGVKAFGVCRIKIIDDIISTHPNNLDAIAERAVYCFNNKLDEEALSYFIKLAEAGCDKYCNYVNSIQELNKPNQMLIEQTNNYWQTLIAKNKSINAVEYYMMSRISVYDFVGAKQIYELVVAENPDFRPIDFKNSQSQPSIVNQAIYGNSNPFTKDSITNNYINKMRTPGFNKVDSCPICMETKLLIALDCTHFVCADNCYPSTIIINKGCPVCRG